MRVKFKYNNGKRETCECLDSKCPDRECFAPGYWQHRSCNNLHNSGYDDFLSCMNRNYRGCPAPLPNPTKGGQT